MTIRCKYAVADVENLCYIIMNRCGAALILPETTRFFVRQKNRMRSFEIIVEKHLDGYVAYPLGLKGIVVGEGDSREEAVADATSAIEFHLETFGAQAVDLPGGADTFC